MPKKYWSNLTERYWLCGPHYRFQEKLLLQYEKWKVQDKILVPELPIGRLILVSDAQITKQIEDEEGNIKRNRKTL